MDALIQVEASMVTLIIMKIFGPLFVKLPLTQSVMVLLGILTPLGMDTIQEI